MKNPFIAGTWVRGESFFGRRDLLQEVLHGPRPFVWVLGTRRVGKTSFLKQLEFLCQRDEMSAHFVPLFWDLEGSADLTGLRDSLLESVEAVDDRFAALGVDVGGLEAMDLLAILRQLKRKAREAGRQLLFLCDECEELINVEKRNPEVLPRLRRVLQEGESVRTVLAATKRLGLLDLATIPDTSPFLHGFVPPVYLGRLTDEEACSLLSRGGFEPAVQEEISRRTDNHPYLLQLVARRLFETGDLERVVAEIGADELVSRFFEVDYEYLEAPEKEIIVHLVQGHGTPRELEARMMMSAAQVQKFLYGLRQLGYVRQEGERYRVAHHFFENWLRRERGLEDDAVTGAALRDTDDDPRFDAESSIELLRRAQRGDERALRSLCGRYRPAIRRWVDGRLPHAMRSQFDTDELLRETMSGALGRVEPSHEGELWDYLRHELLRRIREELRLLSQRPVASPFGVDADPSVCPEEEAIGCETLQRYEAALELLRPEERQAVVMRIEMSCTYEHVAESLGKPSPGAARMTVCRALVRLGREMAHARR